MATRSAIGIQTIANTVESIYCHNDGYPSWNGRILRENYDAKKTEELMKLGDLSVLAPEIGEYHDYEDYNNRNPNWCVAYGRDRGETGTQSKLHDSPEDFAKYWGDDVDYVYMIDLNGMWVIRNFISNKWDELTADTPDYA